MNQFTKIIAAQLKLREQVVENTLELLEEGCTIPFISVTVRRKREIWMR